MGLTLGFLGCGKMGTALLKGLLRGEAVAPEAVHVFDPATGEGLADDLGVTVAPAAAVVSSAQIVVLAVKPHLVDKALDGLRFGSDQIVVSVAAGVPRARIEAQVGPARVVRTMPNLGVAIGSGTILLHAAPDDPPEVIDAVTRLLAVTGHVEPIGDEYLFHAGTALVGSGPAYAFVAIQAMADGAVAAGMPRAAARRLAAATVRAAGALASQPGAHPEVLKDAVASPGGTTIAALGILERQGFRGALFDAVRAAAERSKALAGDSR